MYTQTSVFIKWNKKKQTTRVVVDTSYLCHQAKYSSSSSNSSYIHEGGTLQGATIDGDNPPVTTAAKWTTTPVGLFRDKQIAACCLRVMWVNKGGGVGLNIHLKRVLVA